MKRMAFVLLSVVLMLLVSHAGVDAKIRVVATIPDLADMAGTSEVTSWRSRASPRGLRTHAVPMKPSFAMLLNRADVLLLMGLGLEHTFLPRLLEAADPKIWENAPGYIDCSVYITPLEVPTRIDRALGEQHPMGNPHFNLDPVAGKAMARAIADGLTRNYPEHGATFKKKHDLSCDARYRHRPLAARGRTATRCEARKLPPDSHLLC